jgi:superfamily II DNA or RNA helicase
VSQFVFGGPERYAHQKMALKKLISVGGTGALLMEPGTGKTCVSLDFCSILALKQPDKVDGVQETRILVIAPLAAVDTWVQQAGVWISPQVNYWAEAIGGSIQQRAETLAARGGQRLTKGPLRQRRTGGGVLMPTPERAEGWGRAWDWSGRSEERPHLHISDGPAGLGTQKPRLIIEVINIDTLSSRGRVTASKNAADYVLDGIRRYNPHLVIIDESHRIKGHTSNVSRLADRIGSVVPRRLILTGTVMPAGPLDVFAQWRFLDPYAFGDIDEDGVRKRATFQRFQSRFAVLGGYLGKQVIGYRNMDELQNVMGQRAVVVLKKDALDLPPVVESVVPVMLSSAEKKAYMDMKKNLSVMFTNQVTGPTATVANRLVQIMRLRQITAGYLPDDMGIVRELGTSKADTIASIVHDTLPSAKRIVVFTLFKHELHMLKQKIEARGMVGGKQTVKVETIGGETPHDERIAIRKRFKDLEGNPERTVLIAQIKTLSLAVNELVTAQDIIFASLSQQRDDLIQAIDRLNRIGQTGDKVTVWFAEAPGTIDGVIRQSHKDGTDLETAVLDHVLQYNPQDFT